MKAEREWFDPAKRSILAKTSPDSVIDVFSFILLVYYPGRIYEGGLFMIPGMATTAKKAPLPDLLYVHCTKLFCTGIPQTPDSGHRSAHLTQFSYGRISRPIRP
jgi:hypothetical protein